MQACLVLGCALKHNCVGCMPDLEDCCLHALHKLLTLGGLLTTAQLLHWQQLVRQVLQFRRRGWRGCQNERRGQGCGACMVGGCARSCDRGRSPDGPATSMYLNELLGTLYPPSSSASRREGSCVCLGPAVEEHRTTIEEMRELLHGTEPARLCCIVFACILRECAGVARTVPIRCEHGPTPGTFNHGTMHICKA